MAVINVGNPRLKNNSYKPPLQLTCIFHYDYSIMNKSNFKNQLNYISS